MERALWGAVAAVVISGNGSSYWQDGATAGATWYVFDLEIIRASEDALVDSFSSVIEIHAHAVSIPLFLPRSRRRRLRRRPGAGDDDAKVGVLNVAVPRCAHACPPGLTLQFARQLELQHAGPATRLKRLVLESGMEVMLLVRRARRGGEISILGLANKFYIHSKNAATRRFVVPKQAITVSFHGSFQSDHEITIHEQRLAFPVG